MKKIIENKKRVFVGLSGGVDSAVTAALLKKQGYEVTGVFMRFWKPRINADFKDADGRGYENSCCSVESEAKARLVASKLQIPFYIFNFAKEFKREVVDYFLAELVAGRTPNPCAVCNPKIKFGLFLERAKKLGADYVATGHFARVSFAHVVIPSRQQAERNLRRMSARIRGRSFAIAQDDSGSGYKLFSAKDKNKDQSYFLAGLSQEQLRQIIFPLGNYTKDEVYILAKKWQLPHQARQSFDICFAGDYQGFLKRYLKMKEGRIVKFTNTTNLGTDIKDKNLPQPLLKEGGSLPLGRVREDLIKVLSQHQGLPLYTIGQRASIGGPGPFYVVKKDTKKNILYVSNNEKDLYQKEMILENVNWLSGQPPELPLKCKIKIRYQGRVEYGYIRTNMSINNLRVLFDLPQRAVTPGQMAVFYGNGGEMLGGGIIQK